MYIIPILLYILLLMQLPSIESIFLRGPIKTKEYGSLIDKFKKKYESLMFQSEVDQLQKYQAIAAFTGTFVQLTCNASVDEDEVDNIRWLFSPIALTDNLNFVVESEYLKISPQTKILKLFNLNKTHEGEYICRLYEDTILSIYELHVFSSTEEPIKEDKVRNPEVPLPLKIPNTGFILWNNFGPFTNCSRCGKVGRRIKIGFCEINHIENLLPEIVNSANTSSELKMSIDQVNKIENLIKKFPNGIPCRSNLLLSFIQENKIIKSFPTVVLQGFCKVSCPSNKIVEIISKLDNKIADKLNNTGGVFSVLQTIPKISTGIIITTTWWNVNENFTLICPNYLASNSPTEWSSGIHLEIKILKKRVLESVSNGRISINHLNEIVFKPFLKTDSKIYACFKDKKLGGVIKLKHNKEVHLKEEYLQTLKAYPIFMITLIFGLLFFISLKLCMNYKKAEYGEKESQRQKQNLAKLLEDFREDKIKSGNSRQKDIKNT